MARKSQRIPDFEHAEALGFVIYQTAARIRHGLAQAFAARGFDLSTEQWGVLKRLWERDGQTQRELVDQLGKEKASITRIIDLLENRGLLKRKIGQEDRRNRQIFLTATGRALEEQVVPIAYEFQTALLAELSPAKQTQMKKALRTMQENIDRFLSREP